MLVTILQFKLSDFCLYSLGHAVLTVTTDDDVMEEKEIYSRQRSILAT